nr:MAG TPA: hypothetical protein [Caudoviricetes sp.]
MFRATRRQSINPPCALPAFSEILRAGVSRHNMALFSQAQHLEF